MCKYQIYPICLGFNETAEKSVFTYRKDCGTKMKAAFLVYLVVGGYVATAYTDLIQGIVMIVGVVCLVVAVLNHDSVGGIGNLLENLRNFQSLPNDPNPTTGAQLTNLFGGSSFKFLCFNIMLTSFGTWGLPQMIGKFYAIKDTAAIKRGTIISTISAQLSVAVHTLLAQPQDLFLVVSFLRAALMLLPDSSA